MTENSDRVTGPLVCVMTILFLFSAGMLTGVLSIRHGLIIDENREQPTCAQPVYADPHVIGEHLVLFTISPPYEGLTITAKTEGEPAQIFQTDNASRVVMSLYPLKKYTIKLDAVGRTFQIYPSESEYIIPVPGIEEPLDGGEP